MTSTGPAGAAVHRRVLIAAALAATLLTACGDDEPTEPGDDPRALTSEEAELLSLTRFRLHQQETVPVEMEWPGTPATELDVTLDLHAGLAWGRMESDGAERFILWDSKALGTAPLGDDLPAADEWSTRRLTTEVPQDIFMMLALTLGADRPENPVLLQQNSARFLRHDEVDGTRVTVMEGPRPAQGSDARESRTRYWIDDEGNLLRFESYLGDRSGELATVTVVPPHDEIEGLAAAASTVLLAGQR